MIGVTVTEWKRRGRHAGKNPNSLSSSSSKLLCSTCLLTNCQSTRSVSSLHHPPPLRPTLPSRSHHHHIFLPPPLSPLPPVPLPPLLLLLCLDLGRLELPPTHPPTTLCPPASYESHGGQGPRGCQGLLMTPSPAITSG